MLIEMRGIETNTGLLVPYYVFPWTRAEIDNAFSGGKCMLQEYINPYNTDLIDYMPQPQRGAWRAALKESWELGGNPAAYLGMNAGTHRLLAADGSNSTAIGSTITISPTSIGWEPQGGYEVRLVRGSDGGNRWTSSVGSPGGYSSGIRSLLRDGLLNPSISGAGGMPKTWVQTSDNQLIILSPYVDYNGEGWMYLVASTGFGGVGSGADQYKTVHIKWIDTEDTGGDTMTRFNPRIKTGSMGAYVIGGANVDRLNRFTTDLWETDLIEGIRSSFIGDGRNALLGLRFFYGLAYSEDLVVPNTWWFIKLGNVTFDVSALRTDSEFCSFDFGELVVPRSYGDYRDYTEVQYRAHLPFLGIVDLDPQEVVGKSVYLRYMINLTDGSAIVSLSNDANYPNSSGTFFSATCQWGYDVPLQIEAVRDTTSAAINLGLRTVGGIAAGAAVGGPVGAIAGGVVGAMSATDANQAQSYSTGSLSPNANVMGDFEAKIVAYRRDDLSGDIETSLGKAAGGNVKVGDLSGFAQFDVIYNGGILPMRRSASIIAKLQEGIYIND